MNLKTRVLKIGIHVLWTFIKKNVTKMTIIEIAKKDW